MIKKSILLLSLLLSSSMSFAQINLDIDASKKDIAISPTLYGIFFEDINHAADGGLYAELIRNRSFEDNDTAAVNWKTFETAGATADMSLVNTKLLNDKQGHALQLNINATSKALAGISNEGFWGINAVQGRTYKLSFWAKAKGKYKGHLIAALMDEDGGVKYAETTVDGNITKEWKKYTAVLTSNGNDAKARFVLLGDSKGSLFIDVVSLFPPTFKNRDNGCRPELAQLLYNLHPRFMRFPGGCFVEGNVKPENAFHWERTVGPIEERPGHQNKNWGYRTSDGMGFHEFLQFSEDIGAKPLYVVNIGLWHGGFTPVDSIQPWIDECMQALEYANGDITTKYGKMRAQNGHPQPFNIEYIEVGNENNQPRVKDQSDHYYDRYVKFRNAILAKYPKMHIIGNVVAWGTDNPKWENDADVDIVDEHYYRSPIWFADNFNKYDFYSRNSYKVYSGEYAVTSNFGKTGNLNAALGESVFMMGMENNSDVVIMNSYAPIFVNENDVKWQPDMIRYNSSDVMCTPSYYAQKLMANNIGDYLLKVSQTNPYKDKPIAEPAGPKSVKVGLATWNSSASFDDISIESNSTNIKNDCDNTSSWDMLSGLWKADNGNIVQSSLKESCVNVLKNDVVGHKYIYKVKARNDGGEEGFILVFNYVDKDNYCWFNLGGWGNTQHGIEQMIDGAKSTVATKQGKIEKGKWYDARVEVKDDSIRCYLDNKQIFNIKLRNAMTGFYSNASIDSNTNTVIVKLVNTSNSGTTAKINIQNMKISDACVTRLSSKKGSDENTMNNPTNVYPTEETLSPSNNSVEIFVPGSSLNIVRLK